MNPILADLRPFLKGFLGALSALWLAVSVWALWNVWVDHLALRQVIGILNTLATKHPDLFK